MAPRTALMLLAVIGATGLGAYEAALAFQMWTKGRIGWRRLPASVYRRHVARVGNLPPVRNVREGILASRRAKAMRACMPDALRLLSSSLGSGSSLVQALEYAAHHCGEPLASELQRAVWDLGAGRSFAEAMDGLRRRTGGSGFAYLAVAMEIQHVSGGSLNATIASVADSLRQSAELEDELKAKTAQGRLSARIVSATPVVLLVVLSVFSQGYVERFFESAQGIALFVFALLLEALGIVLVKRALNVDVVLQIEGA